MDAAVLVLNADLGPLHRVTLRQAIRMLVRQVAEVHADSARSSRAEGTMPTRRRG